ncbi:ribbon-helix-helix domain-containing protein [Leucobacter albus]|uniref:Ribbon-helix-helix domain-containing protein n=1 Tax=Leucobacter albus TaxID=272210 RepID=A0ABW3TN88_9MICO
MRTSQTVGFAVGPEMRPALDEVVEHFGHGNRSEFLRVAVREYQARLRVERLHGLRAEARAERGGKVLSAPEVMELINAPTASE